MHLGDCKTFLNTLHIRDPPTRWSVMPTINHDNPLYNQCDATTLGGDLIGPCAEFHRQLCAKDEYGFSAYCTRQATRHTQNEVLQAYDQLVGRWLDGHKGPNFPVRGWDDTQSGRDTNNVLDFCNNTRSTDAQGRCDNWFRRQCESNNSVDVVRYPWCACMVDAGYDMSYYDPDKKVFGNENITAIAPGGSVVPIPDEPYCFATACRNNRSAYQVSKNRRGEHGCPKCVNVLSLENVDFINSNIVQTCDIGDYDQVSPTPPTPSPEDGESTKVIRWVKDHKEPVIGTLLLVGVMGFALVLFVVVKRRKSAAVQQKQALRKGFALSQFIQRSSTNRT